MRSGKGNLRAVMRIEEKQGAVAHGLLQTKHKCSPSKKAQKPRARCAPNGKHKIQKYASGKRADINCFKAPRRNRKFSSK